MQAVVNCIILRQFISDKSHNATITVIDLDIRRELTFTWVGGALDPEVINDLTPRRLALGGLQLRAGGESGSKYLQVETVSDGTPLPSANGKQAAKQPEKA